MNPRFKNSAEPDIKKEYTTGCLYISIFDLNLRRSSDLMVSMKTRSLHIRKVAKAAGKTIFIHKLLNEGDRVLIGLSGGKDSLSLVDILADWNARSPVKVCLHAAHIGLDGIGHEIVVPVLERFCSERNVDFHHRVVPVDMNRDQDTDKCFICAWYRRKALFTLARELSCTKLALGHHLDDIIVTLLMNMSFRGNISTMSTRVRLFDGKLTIIRPLGEIEESAIVRYAELKKIDVQKVRCEYGKDQARAKFRGIIDQIAGNNPRVRRNIYNSMGDIRKEYLPDSGSGDSFEAFHE
jgi:tRNA 2-thiocytidine biosynthesis protein TtcA